MVTKLSGMMSPHCQTFGLFLDRAADNPSNQHVFAVQSCRAGVSWDYHRSLPFTHLKESLISVVEATWSSPL